MQQSRQFQTSAIANSESDSYRTPSPYPFALDISPQDTDKLLTLQKNFERDPRNSEACWEYFRELNRQGKFLTVIRLYKTDELQLLEKRNGDYREKIRE